MKLETQRRIDRLVGVPACILLTSLLRLRRWWRGGRTETHPERRSVLFIELSEMGSTIISSAAVARIKARYPNGKHGFVIFKRNAASLHLLRMFEPEAVFEMRDDSLLGMLSDVLRFMVFCRRRGIDTAIDLELFSRVSSLLSLLSGAETRVGFHNYRAEGLSRGEHLTHPVNYNPYVHMAQNFGALVESLAQDPGALPFPKVALPLERPPVRLGIDRESLKHVRAELLERFPLTARHRLVIVNHDAGQLIPLRTWPEDRYAEFIRRLLATEPEVVVVLLGIEEGRPSADRIVANVNDNRCVSFVGATRHLVDVVQLYHLADLLVSNDSGPPHFAALTSIPVITLFGPETPRLYGPLGEKSVDLFAGLACSPCLTAYNHRNSPCTDNQCLKAISVEMVLESARTLLRESRSREALPPDLGLPASPL